MTALRGRHAARITIRNLDSQLKARLQLRAAQHERESMEEEAREILRTVLAAEQVARGNLANAIHERFARLGGVEVPVEPRQPMREPR